MGTELKRGSVTVSCRLDKTLYELLQVDAKARSISLNSLITGIMRRYVSWEKYADEVGFVPLFRETVRLIFEYLHEEQVQEIAERLAVTVPREMLALMFNKSDFNSIVVFLEVTLSRYGTVHHKISGTTHDFIIYHNVNKKFSNFLAHAAKVMAEDLSFKLDVLNIDSKILSLRIDEING